MANRNVPDLLSGAWCRKHRSELLSWLPDVVVDDPKRVRFVIQEATDFETGWNAEWLTDDQARAFLQFLHVHIANPIGWDLIQILESRVTTA
jgi:hypothetical protein